MAQHDNLDAETADQVRSDGCEWLLALMVLLALMALSALSALLALLALMALSALLALIIIPLICTAPLRDTTLRALG